MSATAPPSTRPPRYYGVGVVGTGIMGRRMLAAVQAVLGAGKACLCEKPLTHEVRDALAP